MQTSRSVLSGARLPDAGHIEQAATHLPDRWRSGRKASQTARRSSARALARAILFATAAALLLLFFSSASAQSPNPVPFISLPLVPDAVVPGGADFTLTVNGAGFVSGATVTWNGVPLATTFVNGSRLTATVPASQVVNAQSVWIAVENPYPGGGRSSMALFTVIPPGASASFVGSPGSPVPLATAPQSLAAGYFNSDGWLDLAVADAGGTMTILLGEGGGTFTPAASSPAAGLAPASIATGDFTGEGRLDLAIANSGSNSVTILLGNGDGTFAPAPSSPVAAGSQPSFVAAADLNADGRLDLAVANSGSNSVTILLGNGDGTFAPAAGSPIPVGTGPQCLAVGDFNGDGKLDLAIANSGSNNVAILLGNGSGGFAPAASSPIAAAGQPSFVAAGDFNRDARLDLAVTNQNSNSVTILLGKGDGTFTAAGSSPATGNGPRYLALADLNGDSNLDLAVVNLFDHNVTILLGSGDGAFIPADASPGIGSNPSGVAAADFSSDGRIDLATASSGDDTVSILVQPLVPAVALSPASLTFPDQLMGATSAPQSISVKSAGTAPLYLTGISASGNFAAATTCPVAGAEPGCNTGFPSGLVPYTNVYYITKPGFDSSLYATVQMVVGEPTPNSYAVLLTPLPSLIGETFCGLVPLTASFSAEAYVPTAAQRNGDYSTFSVQLTDPLTGLPFVGNIIPPSMLVPGGLFAWPITVNQASSCSIDATFTPGATGPVNGTLSLTGNALDSPQTVALSGTGVSAAVVSLSTANLKFPGQLLGSASAAQTVTLSNTGGAVLSIAGISAGGGDFAETNNCPASLGAGASCAISVTFAPKAAGTTVGTLTINSDAAGSPHTVTLTGQGHDFSLEARTLSQTTSFGLAAAYDLVLSPAGGFNHTVNLTCSGAPIHYACKVEPASITLDGTNTVALKLTVGGTATASVLPGRPRNLAPPAGPLPLSRWLALLGLLGLIALAGLSRKNSRYRRLAPFATLALLAALWVACGGSWLNISDGTPPGNYTLTVTGTSGSLSHSTQVTLKVQ